MTQRRLAAVQVNLLSGIDVARFVVCVCNNVTGHKS